MTVGVFHLLVPWCSPQLRSLETLMKYSQVANIFSRVFFKDKFPKILKWLSVFYHYLFTLIQGDSQMKFLKQSVTCFKTKKCFHLKIQIIWTNWRKIIIIWAIPIGSADSSALMNIKWLLTAHPAPKLMWKYIIYTHFILVTDFD